MRGPFLWLGICYLRLDGFLGIVNGALSCMVRTPNLQNMGNTLAIRAATIDDLDRLGTLYVQLSADNSPLPKSAAEAIFKRFVCYDGSVILIGEVDRVLVSSCTLVIIPNLTRNGMPYALIENVITHKDHRRSGYAKSLLDAATAKAWAQGCYKVMLLTGATERKTLEFYEGAGFAQTKTGFQKRRELKG